MISPSTSNNMGTGLVMPSNMPKVVPDAVKKAMDTAHKMVAQVSIENAAPPLIGLAARVKNSFEASKNARNSSGVDDLLVQCLNQVNGKYDTNVLNRIRAATPGGSEVFMMLSDVKSRACASILRNTMTPPGTDKPWGIDPTPIPELPQAKEVKIIEQIIDEVAQQIALEGQESISEDDIEKRKNEIEQKARTEAYKFAKMECQKMEHYVDDMLTEGKFYEAFSDFLTDISIFPTAFIKGPVIRNRPRIVWTYDQNGRYVPGKEYRPAREYYRVSPFDMYPSPGAKNINDGSLCEHHRLRRSELNAMIGVPGFKDTAIKAVLEEYGRGGLRHWLLSDSLRAHAEGRPDEDKDPDPVIDAIEYWGFAQGNELLEWGFSNDVIKNPERDYQINAWLIGSWVIMARLNPHPLNHRPYYCESYSRKNDSVWGKSPPMLMKDTQNICNAVARALLNRAAFASGPLAEIQWDRLAQGENVTGLKPWMIIKTRSDISGRGGQNKAVYLEDIEPKSEIFLKVYQYFFNQASEQTGIPNYIYGENTSSQAHKTSSGLAMLINNTNALMKDVILAIDKNIIKPIIYETWLNIMMYENDVPKSGDINIIARASEYLIAQEQLQMRRNEALQNTNNPWDRSIIGDKGRAAMLRDSFKSMKFDVDEIIPSEDDMDQRERDMIQQLVARVQELETQLKGSGSPSSKSVMVDDAGGGMGMEPGRTMQ